MGTAGPNDLVAHLARFAGLLRDRGMAVGVADEVDAAGALTLVDLLDPGEVRLALRTTLKVPRWHWDDFDEAFREAWIGSGERAARGVGAGRAGRGAGAGRKATPALLATLAAAGPPAPQGGDRPGYSPDALLRRKPFEACSADDLSRMARLLDRLALRLATRRSRRLVPAPSRGLVDPRRSLRRALGTGGELLSLARRARRVEEPRLVVLCDTSGSMDAHVRFLLAFVIALKRSVPRTEVFAFNTRLTRLTPWLARSGTTAMLDRIADAVPDWSGGTRIGECLTEFVAGWLGQLVNRATVVIIFSDGLDRGDTAPVAGAMRAIRAQARRVLWLNPLAGDARYEPAARAMQLAMPFVDRLVPAHNLESLEEMLSELTVRR